MRSLFMHSMISRAILSKLLADLHAHPANDRPDEATLEMLCSGMLVGLAHINGNSRILTYEQATQRFNQYVTEIEPGRLAHIEHPRLGSGYFMRTQEIIMPTHHVLAVGWEGDDYFPSVVEAQDAIDSIHHADGLAILNHPFVTPSGGSLIKYRVKSDKEIESMHALLESVDAIEAFNAQCISPLFGALVPDMRKANERAAAYAQSHNVPGTAASDTHNRFDQVGRAGIYVNGQNVTTKRLKSDIRHARFELKTQYVGKLSFGLGMFPLVQNIAAISGIDYFRK